MQKFALVSKKRCTPTNKKPCLQGSIQGEENIRLTALGFAASKAVCGSDPK